jgi:serine/threonine-protein kinase
MKPAAHLKSVEWHEPAYQQVDHAPTLSDAERPSFAAAPDDEDDDERGSGVHVRKATDENGQEVEGGAPHRVGPYRLIERIGSGAMGHVYRAEHTLLGRVVAIKMLRAELTCEEACVHRFLAEARAVNLIKHAHIIDVTDFACTESGQPWFVMEMLEGSDLSLAASLEPFSLPRTLEVVRQVCEALATVHAAGIVHRDVKPENIFLAQREGKDFVTLLDFGIARLPDPTSPDPMQEGLMGTPHYMAPEQVSASPIDHRADLYAVGSTLFELVAGVGKTPFRAATLQKQLMDVMMTPAPRLSDRAMVPAIVREDLDRLVARCLAKQPEDRPASAREIADELAAIALKLEGRTSAISTPATDAPTLRLSGSDAVVVALPEVAARRKRARRELRARKVWSSRGATVLSAVAAAAAMWVATSETSWAHALSKVTAWGAAAAAAHAPEHVVTPDADPLAQSAALPIDEGLSLAHVAQPTGGVGAPAPVLAASGGRTDIDLELGADVAIAPEGLSAAMDEAEEDLRFNDEARRARRSARAKARAERAEQAAPLTITQSQEAGAVEAAEPAAEPAEEPSFDRDLVLNPFDK